MVKFKPNFSDLTDFLLMLRSTSDCSISDSNLIKSVVDKGFKIVRKVSD